MRRKPLVLKILCAFMISTALIWPAAAQAVTLSESLDNVIRNSGLTGAAQEKIEINCKKAVEAGISREDVEVIVARGLSRGSGAETVSSFLATAVSIRERGLPVQPVLERLQLGLAKGVSDDRLQASIQRMGEMLAAAQPLVADLGKKGMKQGRPGIEEQAVATTARALEKGIPSGLLTETGELVLKREGSLSLYDKTADTLTLMVESGIEPGAGARVVRSAVDKGYAERDLAKMDREIADDVAKGRRSDDILSRAESRIGRNSFGQGNRMGGDAVRGLGSGPSGGGFGGRMERRR